jgi:replicative DNA helicase
MNREQQVAFMSRRFKQLALQYRIPIIALAQMSRGYEKENRKPRLSDLRESGSLEQDADRVWFLHQEADAQPIGSAYPVELIQAKCRGGSERSLDIGFQKNITKFVFNPLIQESNDLI